MNPIPLERLNRGGLIIMILATLVCGYWVFNDVHTMRKQFRIESNVLSEKLREVNLAQTNLGDLKTALQSTSTELAYLNERIPESGKIGLLLQQFDALLRQRQVRLISITPLPAVEEKIYVRNPIRLIFEGRFIDIFHLLADMERMNRIVIMDHMIVTHDEPRMTCRVELKANVFERKKNSFTQIN